MLVIRILSMLLFPLQGRGLAVQVPHDPGQSTVLSVEFFHVYRTEILPVVSRLEFDGRCFFFLLLHERSVRS